MFTCICWLRASYYEFVNTIRRVQTYLKGNSWSMFWETFLDPITFREIRKHNHILISMNEIRTPPWQPFGTACCNTFWLKACVANWSWRIWEWLLMGYNADHTHLSWNMSHDLHSLLWISVGRCCWSDFVYFQVTQYITPSKPSSRYFRCKCWSFYGLYFR